MHIRQRALYAIQQQKEYTTAYFALLVLIRIAFVVVFAVAVVKSVHGCFRSDIPSPSPLIAIEITNLSGIPLLLITLFFKRPSESSEIESFEPLPPMRREQ